MRDLIPDQVTGTVQLQIALADEPGAHHFALADLVATWVGAVDIGFFGEGRMSLLKAVEARGRSAMGTLRCERVSPSAFRVLSRMLRHFSQVKARVESTSVVWEEGHLSLLLEDGVPVPSLPQRIPFTVDYANDFHADVRVEIEFRHPLPPAEKDAIFAALSTWDVLVEALADEQGWGEESDYETRMMSPTTIEHLANGYFASPDCFDFIVHLGLRLHQHLPIERISFE